jgi:methyltransferase (TIGR00027 family)
MAHVRDTAATIAQVRADESRLPPETRLFADPYAALFCDGDAEVDARFVAIPYFRESIRLRTRLIDDALRAALADRIAQVVLLGVGFDCRALRMPEIAAARATVFEVDFAAQLAHKAARLAASGIRPPAWVRAVACDFSDERFDEALARDLVESGLRATDRAAFVWEGVVGYLDDAAADRTLRLVAGLAAAGSSIVFNYAINRFDPASLSERVRRAGFARLEDVSLAEAHARLLGGEPPAEAELFRVALART